MGEFFHTTRKAWAAAAVALSAGWTDAIADGTVAGTEITTIAVVTVVAWVVTWAVPNRPPAA